MDDKANLFTNPPKPTGRLPGEPEPQPMGEEEVAPEEQAQYDKVVKFAASLIYKNAAKTLAMMNDKEKSVHENVGHAGAELAGVIEASAQAKGETISPDVMLHAGAEVIEMLMDLGVQTKTFPLDPEGEEYQQEMAMALMEAERIVGEGMLKDPKKSALYSEQAADLWSQEVAKEVDSGQADPEYTQMAGNLRQQGDPINVGVRKALGK